MKISLVIHEDSPLHDAIAARTAQCGSRAQVVRTLLEIGLHHESEQRRLHEVCASLRNEYEAARMGVEALSERADEYKEKLDDAYVQLADARAQLNVSSSRRRAEMENYADELAALRDRLTDKRILEVALTCLIRRASKLRADSIDTPDEEV